MANPHHNTESDKFPIDRAKWVSATLFLVSAFSAAAAPPEDSDLDALNTADQAVKPIEMPSDWHTFIEGAYGDTQQRYSLPSYASGRLSLDTALDKTLAPGWRLVFADRLDLDWQDQAPQQARINTLKELYLSWQFAPDQIIDAGRINTRYGVATGYNPTDYFRSDAVRSQVSVNPSSLRNNRLGSVMLRGQTLWNGGSLTGIVSPKLDPAASSEPYNVDLGATNHANRYLLALSEQFSDAFNPQFLVYGEQGKSAQFGFDLTHLIGDATVAFVEWSGGQGASLYAQSTGGAARETFCNRLATGFTYTTPGKVSITVEAEYNGAAMDESNWNALGKGPLPRYLQYRNFVQAAQDIPTKEAAFAYVSWQDAFVTHLDLTALARQDLLDQSRLAWAEARYHWIHADAALQWQHYGGKAWSDFGVLPARTTWQTVVTYYF
ncbi:MAG TPA: hypothetical protein VIF60_00010 [Burkholderiaceae bacterium]